MKWRAARLGLAGLALCSLPALAGDIGLVMERPPLEEKGRRQYSGLDFFDGRLWVVDDSVSDRVFTYDPELTDKRAVPLAGVGRFMDGEVDLEGITWGIEDGKPRFYLLQERSADLKHRVLKARLFRRGEIEVLSIISLWEFVTPAKARNRNFGYEGIAVCGGFFYLAHEEPGKDCPAGIYRARWGQEPVRINPRLAEGSEAIESICPATKCAAGPAAPLDPVGLSCHQQGPKKFLFVLERTERAILEYRIAADGGLELARKLYFDIGDDDRCERNGRAEGIHVVRSDEGLRFYLAADSLDAGWTRGHPAIFSFSLRSKK